jgi:hypothetical protein
MASFRTASSPIVKKKYHMAQVNPKVDIAFKKLFGVEENKDLLISID